MTQFLEDGPEDTYEVSVKNSSDLFSFKKEKEHVDPFAVGIDELKKIEILQNHLLVKMVRQHNRTFFSKR
jgi:hypothetical protein